MSLDGTYDPNNIFARILRGDLPAAKIYEDNHVCAFLDAFPQAKGHALVVPKNVEARHLLDCPPQSLPPLIQTAQRVGNAIVAALHPDGLIVNQFNGASAGQTVFHPHIHLIPHYREQQPEKHRDGSMADPNTLTPLAITIARHGLGDGFVRSS